MFDRKSKIITKVYWSYSDIPLKVYLEVANTGNLGLLSKDGVSDEKCILIWDELIKLNSKQNNDLCFLSYVSNLRVFAALLADYNIIKASLLKLMFQVDDEIIAWLRTKGYVIVTTGATVYAESIARAMHASDAIVTQITMRRNKLLVKSKEQESVAPIGIEEVIANLSFSLGYEVSDGITLARFNEYKKIIRAKNEARRKHGS